MRSLLVLFVSTFSLMTYADSPEFLQLRDLYEKGTRFDTNLIPESGTIFLRGNCYYRHDTITQPPRYQTAVVVLHSRSFPSNGPIVGRRLIQGAVFQGLQTDQEALDLFLKADKASPGYGYLEPRWTNAHEMAADLTSSSGHFFHFATINTNGPFHYAMLYRSRESLDADAPLMACYFK